MSPSPSSPVTIRDVAQAAGVAQQWVGGAPGLSPESVAAKLGRVRDQEAAWKRLAGLAPSPSRRPISCVRCATEYDITP